VWKAGAEETFIHFSLAGVWRAPGALQKHLPWWTWFWRKKQQQEHITQVWHTFDFRARKKMLIEVDERWGKVGGVYVSSFWWFLFKGSRELEATSPFRPDFSKRSEKNKRWIDLFVLLKNWKMFQRIGDEENETKISVYIVLPETISESGELSNHISQYPAFL
jgi:hypothetical protein